MKKLYVLLFLCLVFIHKSDSQNVGVGTATPNSKLEIQGISGDENSAGILRLSNTSGNTNLRLGTLDGSRSWIQSHASLPLHINRLGNNVILNELGGNVGIGVASPVQKLHLGGNFRMDGVSVEGNATYRVYRNLATYNNTSAAAQGAFVIVTSQPWNSASMFRVKLEGYFYDATSTFEMTIGGYMFINNDFYNYGYTSNGSQSLQVRLGRNIATNTIAIIIGSESSSYSYPKITVSSFMQGHSNINESYAVGWTINQLTNLSGVIDYMVTVPDITRLNGLGAGDFIRNQFASAQTANFWVSGEGRVGGNLFSGNHFVNESGDPYFRTNADNKHIVLSGGSGWAHTGATMVLRGASAGHNAHGIELYTGNAERVRILSNGNVGIGTTSPAHRLDVQGGHLRVGTLYGPHVMLGTLGSFDTRNTNPNPEIYNMGLTSEFKSNTANGLNDGGNYNSVLSLRQWSSGTDWSGGGVHQLGFTQNGNIWHRYSETTGSWGPWRRVLTTGSGTSRADIIFVRGTGLNNNANRIVRIGGTEHVNSATRGLTLTIINKSNHAVVSSTNYDTYGSTAASDNLANALNAINNGQIGILTSYDAWEDAVTTNLKNAFRRLGLYKAMMTSTGARRPYAAIFEASSNSGIPSVSAVEIEHSNDGNQPYAELRGWLIDGAFVATTQVPSGLATPVGVNAVNVNESGDVGIGTNAPDTKLMIQSDHGNTRLRLFSDHYGQGYNGANTANMTIWASEPGMTWTGVGIGNNIYNFTNFPRVTNTRGGSYMRLLDNQINFNVVNSSGTDISGLRVLPGAYGMGGIGVGGFHTLNSHSNGWLYLGDQNGSVYGGRGIALDNLWVQSTAYFAGSNGIWNSSGNVGIGTTIPSERLDVAGNARISTLAGTGNRPVYADANGVLTTSSGGTSAEGAATIVPLATFGGEVIINSTSWQRVTRTTYSSIAALFSAVPITPGATRKYYLVIRRADNQPGGTGSHWRFSCDGGWNGGNDVAGHGFSLTSNWGSPSEGTTDWIEIPPTAVSDAGCGTAYWKIDARMANAGQSMRVMSISMAAIDIIGGTTPTYSAATTGNASNPPMSFLYENIWSNTTGGNVGIGTTAPGQRLDVVGVTRSRQGIEVNSGDVTADNNFGIYFHGSGDRAYAIYRESGGWSHPYPDLRIGFHTGIKLGANAQYNGIRFYTDYDMSGLVMSVNDVATGGVGNVYMSGSLGINISPSVPFDVFGASNFGHNGACGARLRVGWYYSCDPIIVPTINNYGYVGGPNPDGFYRMYSYGYLNPSDSKLKKDIHYLASNKLLAELVMTDIDKIKPAFYKYNNENDEMIKGAENRYRPQMHLGVMIDDAPDYIKDESFSAIDIYGIATLSLAGVQYNRNEIKEIKKHLGIEKHISVNDFGTAIINGKEIWIKYSEDFLSKIAGVVPAVVLTSSDPHISLAVTEKKSDGFKVTTSAHASNLHFDWMAIAKIPVDAPHFDASGQTLESGLYDKLRVPNATKSMLIDYYKNLRPTETPVK